MSGRYESRGSSKRSGPDWSFSYMSSEKLPRPFSIDRMWGVGALARQGPQLFPERFLREPQAHAPLVQGHEHGNEEQVEGRAAGTGERHEGPGSSGSRSAAGRAFPRRPRTRRAARPGPRPRARNIHTGVVSKLLPWWILPGPASFFIAISRLYASSFSLCQHIKKFFLHK